MSLRYWHKLALLMALLALSGVILTASYAHVLSRQAMARSEVEQHALAKALLSSAAELVGRALPTLDSPTKAANDAEATDPLAAAATSFVQPLFRNSTFAESQIERLWVCRAEGKSVIAVFTQSPGASDSTQPGSGEDQALSVELQTHLLGQISKPGKGSPTNVTSKFGSGEGLHLHHPVLDKSGKFAGWILAKMATLSNDRLDSARASLVTFAISLCAVLMVASGVAAWMFGRRMRELGAALTRVGDGHSDVHLDDESADEMGDLARAANHTARTLRETNDLRRSMRLAELVQRALLPAKPPTLPGVQIAHFCDYCDEVGGDYIDYIPVGDGDRPDGWAVVVGDGTGHGVGAALLMATARSVLRTHALRFSELAQSVGLINRRICEQVPDGKFVTLFMLVFSADACRICWLSAGHDEAILFDPLSNDFSELRGSDVPLGVEASWEFTHHTRQSALARGSVIVIGTDGIWEMRNAGEAMFGKDRLKRVIRRAAGETADNIGRQILEALHQHRGEMPPQDDVTFVVLKMDG